MGLIEQGRLVDQARYISAANLLGENGVRPYDPKGAEALFYCAAAEVRLRKPHSSFLEIRRDEALSPGAIVLCLEVGGSNGRAVLLQATDAHMLQPILDPEDHPIAVRAPWSTKTFPGPDEFYEEMMRMVEPVLKVVREGLELDAAGGIFSFDFIAKLTKWGVEGRSVSGVMPKGFTVPGIDQQDIGEAMRNALATCGITLPDALSFVIANDSAALALDRPDAYGSIIVATGLGGCVAIPVPEMSNRFILHNVEPAEIAIPLTRLSRVERAVNAASNHPGIRFAEISAGGGLSDQFRYICALLRKEGIVSFTLKEETNAAVISDVLAGNRSAVMKVFEGLEQKDDTSWKILQLVCETLRQRSTQVVGEILAALLWNNPDILANEKPKFACEGPVIRMMPLYASMLNGVIRARLLGRSIDLVPGEGLRGIGYAALRQRAA